MDEFVNREREWRALERARMRPAQDSSSPGRGAIVSEVNFRALGQEKRAALLRDLQLRWERTEAFRRWPVKKFELIDESFLR